MFAFDNTFATELEGFYAPQSPEPVREPAMVCFNRDLAGLLGLDADALDSPTGAAVFAGNVVPEGAAPLAQAYAGHQFGHFNPQLGDGRAILLGELTGTDGRRYDLALKGSGRTPFSRGGDGRAALGPVLREYLMGEAMHALGVPTSRALAAVTTGEIVRRDRPLPGAVLARVASSHLRIGTFQFFAARRLDDFVSLLVGHALRRHDPGLVDDDQPSLALLRGVIARQASLVARWMHLGFVHGVLNTDNTTISGETIDYGPCAFVEQHDPAAVFSSIDTGGRYAFGNQPSIVEWNLARLAEALLPTIANDAGVSIEQASELATEAVQTFLPSFERHWRDLGRAKLGLVDVQDGDDDLLADWVGLLRSHRIDHTLGWRNLAEPAALRTMFDAPEAFDDWKNRWETRVSGDPTIGTRLRCVNPRIVPRNHHVEAAISAAVDDGDLTSFDRLLAAVRSPFDDDPTVDDLATPAPPGFLDGYRTFCGT